MSPTVRARLPRPLPAVALVLLAVLLGACTVGGETSGDGGAGGAGTPGTADGAPGAGTTAPDDDATAPGDDAPSASPATGARQVEVDVDAPQGWTAWQVGSLVFAAPPEFEVSGAAPRGAATLVPPLTEDGELLGAIEVFAEDAQLGPLEVRAELTEGVRTDQVGAPPLEPARALDVPGSEGGTLLLWEYEQVVEPTGREVPSVIGELDILMAEGPQYSASISGATEVLSLDDVEAIVASARVLDVAEG